MKEKNANIIKWKILITTFIFIIVGAGVYGVIINSQNSTEVSSTNKKINETEEQYNQEQIENSAEETVNLEQLESVENKTEEELKKLNEKENEETEKKQEQKAKQEKQEKNNTKKNTSKNSTKNKYYIKVNYGAQVVNIYTYDKNGKYTVPVKAMVCSTGTATPRSGVYKTPAKILWCFMYGNVYAHYCTQIVGNILFHSVPYLTKSNDTLEYWAYDKLGTKASMGCIRLTTRDAKWIYDNVPCGTQVEFYSSSNPGPLGKPTAQKISNAPKNLRGWDPTDPDSRNPWKSYKSSSSTSKKEDTKNNNKQNTSSKNDKNNSNTSNNTQTSNSTSNDSNSNQKPNNTLNDDDNKQDNSKDNNEEKQTDNSTKPQNNEQSNNQETDEQNNENTNTQKNT